jgi:aspartyl-tRNA(Asn)/glutamyl-tRNA(Gln) amidotransferase subunit B
LEVHAQVSSQAKLFSGAATEFGAEPNTQVSLVDAAMPGMLPVINQKCVEQAVRTGLGLKAQINNYSVFDRKNYFYPDLPQGYQISQFQQPIVGEGTIDIDLDGRDVKTVRIERLHLEQDAGKSLHDQHPSMSFVDLNRSGVALMEIVSYPDMRSSAEAQAYVKKLRAILRYLGTCDGNMEQGSLRADVNVSVRRPGDPLGTRCEIKNVNSIRFIGQAIEHEARRQIDIIEDGGTIAQETRLFDPKNGETRSMRSKEEAHDYRYFPDPDLLPLSFSQEFVDTIAASLPELPDDKKARFIADYGLSPYDASILVSEGENADFFEAAAAGRDAKATANMVIGSVFAGLNKAGLSISQSPVSADQVGQLVDLQSNDTVSSRIAKEVFELMFEQGPDQGKDPAVIVEEKGLKQVTDTGAIEAAVDEVIQANPDKVEQARERPKMAGWFVGQVMEATGGKANPQAVNKLVMQKLGLEE